MRRPPRHTLLTPTCLVLLAGAACTPSDGDGTTGPDPVTTSEAADPLAAIPAVHEGAEPGLRGERVFVKSGQLPVHYQHRSVQRDEERDTIDVELQITASQTLRQATVKLSSLQGLELLGDAREWTFTDWQRGTTETIAVALQLAEGAEPDEAYAAFLTGGTTTEGRQAGKAYAVYLVPREEPAAASTIPADEAGTMTRDGATGTPKAQPTDARRPMGEADPR